jgi:ribosomal-protein-alanine N-acetyltransferase
LTRWHLTRATAADISRMVEIENHCFGLPWGRLSFEGELASSNSDSFVARFERSSGEEQLVAYIFFRIIADEVHIFRLAVTPEWRRRGIGSRLVTECLRFARRKGMSSALLEVRPSNAEAVALYTKLGFQIIATRPDYYRDSREDALILKREIKEEGV